MIHIFGDSHANTNFSNIKYNNILNHYQNSITMYRVGRDKLNFINFRSYGIKDMDIIIYQFGEVDCRCHIGKQLLLGRKLDEIILELINNYINSINENLIGYNNIKIIICCVPPQMNQQYFENLHGPITHEFPFIGTNEERINYTLLVNNELKKQCIENSFYFLDYYEYYTNNEGTLKTELSDNICHIRHNQIVLNTLNKIIDNL